MKTNIFQPIKLGPVTVKNRIEVAPAAPFLAGHDCSVSQELYKYTMSLAKSGAGIVTLGVSSVDPQPPVGARCLTVSSPIYMSGLSDMAEGIKSYGAAASIELVHTKYMLSDPMKVVNDTSTEEVEEVIRLFADGAEMCRKAGFDMVLIHGGHGNVPSMFFNKKYNHRTDRFGGSFENRCNFGIELLKAIREKTKGKIAIEYRISAEEVLPDMTTLEETLEYSKRIKDYIDLLHVSRGLLEVDSLLPIINAPVYLPKAMNLPYAKRFKEELGIPVSCVGSFDLDIAEKAIGAGDIDMVAMIRTILADTDCVEKARHGNDEQIRPCIRCNTCISRTHAEFKSVRCAVNPLVGRETSFDTVTKAPYGKKVVIVGGGPAGLEAARDCSMRGHKAVIFEKNSVFGGNFNLACAAGFKQEMRGYLDWSVRTVTGDPNIEMKLGVEATPELVRAECPDAVIMAVGSEPIIPKFTASGTDKIVWVGDAEGGARIGNKIVIAGAGFTGLEAALSMSREGKNVTVVDMLPMDAIGAGGTFINLVCLKDLLKEAGVVIRCEVKIVDISEKGVEISAANGKHEIITCDTAVLSFGFRTNSEFINKFRDITPDFYVIGDCSGKGGGNVSRAVTTAFDVSMQI